MERICSVTYEDVAHTSEFLKSRIKIEPVIGIVCGSGLGALADAFTDRQSLEYSEIPNFLCSTVPGHAGRLVFGRIGGKEVMCMQGRFHGYEGHNMAKIAFPIRVMAYMGVQKLIITNACGGLNPSYNIGDLMIMKDHINLPGLAGINPLVGSADSRFGPRFVPLSDAYSKELRGLALSVADSLGFDFVREGVYVIQFGPCFETVTEGKLLRLLGADVTGMSTVPEVIVARQYKMEVLGISLVTNICVNELDSPLTANHEEVLETGRTRAKDLESFVSKIVEEMKIKEDCNDSVNHL